MNWVLLPRAHEHEVAIHQQVEPGLRVLMAQRALSPIVKLDLVLELILAQPIELLEIATSNLANEKKNLQPQ